MALAQSFRSIATRRSARLPYIIVVAFILTTSLFYYTGYHVDAIKLPPLKLPTVKIPPVNIPFISPSSPSSPSTPPQEYHPIDDLVQSADSEFEALLSKEVHDLPSAASAYRSRRGRHPPPRFDEWVKWAQDHKVVLIEDLFDQIYKDLEPFWALPAKEIQEAAASYEFVMSIRAGKLTKEDGRYRMFLWHKMLEQLDGLLPDVDLAWNIMDESRVLVPYETVSEYVATAATRGRVQNNEPANVSNFAQLPAYVRPEPRAEWIKDRNYWLLTRDTCPPSSGAQEADPILDLASPLDFPSSWPSETYHGYVSNWTVAKDPCAHLHLRGLHGSFIEPLSISTSKKLFPILGGSKLPMNNDILVPAPRYWEDDPKFAGGVEGRTDWNSKKDEVMWRGVASGGRNKPDNWARFQRHRFISMLNASHVRDALHQQPDYDIFNAPIEQLGPRPAIFPLPGSGGSYDITALNNFDFEQWVQSFARDAGFVDLLCFPTPPKEQRQHCSYTEPFYKVEPFMDMPTMYEHKYLPDIDGNSFSGRYRALLRSHSLPIKATIYSEWHDDRLIAWKHFVPMDNTFVDFYGIMDYFLGYKGGENGSGAKRGHDDVARKVALAGRDWAEKVMRREDMLAYMYRLILEYARIVDERRESMGFTGDLAEKTPSGEGTV